MSKIGFAEKLEKLTVHLCYWEATILGIKTDNHERHTACFDFKESIFHCVKFTEKQEINDVTQQDFPEKMSHQISIVLRSCESLYKYILQAGF